MQRALSFSECPGGPQQLSASNSVAARRRMEQDETAVQLLPEGPMVADESWFLEAEACRVAKPIQPDRCTDPDHQNYDPQHDSCFDLRTCINKFPCSEVKGKDDDPDGYACYGLRKKVLKDIVDTTNEAVLISQGCDMDSEPLKLGIEVIDDEDRDLSTPRDCNPCYRMHLIARDVEGVPESDLEIILTGDEQDEQRQFCTDNEEYCAANNLLVGGRDPPPTYFYTDQGMCQDNYVDAITEARKRRGSGLSLIHI